MAIVQVRLNIHRSLNEQAIDCMKTFYEGHDDIYKKRLAAGARGWDDSEDGYEVHQSKLATLLAEGHAPRSGSLLELGCGAGNIGLWFAGRGYAVSGIDIAPTAIALAQRRAAEFDGVATFVLGNVVDLEPFADDAFDFVYDSHLLHCIIGDDRAKLFESVHRVMKPDGYFLVDTMCYGELTPQIQNFDPETHYTIRPDGLATRYIGNEDDIVDELLTAGFALLDRRRVDYSDGHSVMVELRRRLDSA
jgi:SAM-dependent methyltransferase